MKYMKIINKFLINAAGDVKGKMPLKKVKNSLVTMSHWLEHNGITAAPIIKKWFEWVIFLNLFLIDRI